MRVCRLWSDGTQIVRLPPSGQVQNTASMQRLNATFRACLCCLVRRGRALAQKSATLEAGVYLVGCVYNFCHVHATLSGTPAMAADLTDHIWSIDELIRYRCRRE